MDRSRPVCGVRVACSTARGSSLDRTIRSTPPSGTWSPILGTTCTKASLRRTHVTKARSFTQISRPAPVRENARVVVAAAGSFVGGGGVACPCAEPGRPCVSRRLRHGPHLDLRTARCPDGADPWKGRRFADPLPNLLDAHGSGNPGTEIRPTYQWSSADTDRRSIRSFSGETERIAVSLGRHPPGISLRFNLLELVNHGFRRG